MWFKKKKLGEYQDESENFEFNSKLKTKNSTKTKNLKLTNVSPSQQITTTDNNNNIDKYYYSTSNQIKKDLQSTDALNLYTTTQNSTDLSLNTNNQQQQPSLTGLVIINQTNSSNLLNKGIKKERFECVNKFF